MQTHTFTAKEVLERFVGDEVFRREMIEQARQDRQVCELLLHEVAPDLIQALRMLKSRIAVRPDGK